MKKNLLIAGGAVLATVLMSGCAGVGSYNGTPGLTGGMSGMTFFSEVSANTMVPVTTSGEYTVVKRDVKATAVLTGYFTAFNFGDASYATLKAEALKQAPGANDLKDVSFDYHQRCICGINTVTVTMTATAIKFKK